MILMIITVKVVAIFITGRMVTMSAIALKLEIESFCHGQDWIVNILIIDVMN